MKSLLLITTVVLLGAVVYGQPYWREQNDTAICYIRPNILPPGGPLSEREKETMKVYLCHMAAIFGK